MAQLPRLLMISARCKATQSAPVDRPEHTCSSPLLRHRSRPAGDYSSGSRSKNIASIAFRVWGSSRTRRSASRAAGSIARTPRPTAAPAPKSASATTAGVSAAMIKKHWDPKVVGASSGVAGLAGAAALIPAAAVVGAVVGATVGFQRSRGTGRPPRWYSRAVSERTELKTWYPVRPPGANRPPTFVG